MQEKRPKHDKAQAKLRDKRHDRSMPEKQQTEEHDDLVIGRNPVRELLRSGAPVDTVYISGTAGGLSEIVSLAQEQGAVIKTVTEQKLGQIAGGGVHQGVAARTAAAAYVSIEDLLAVSAKKGTAPFLIICDGIEDPHNLGAILRTAETAGADGVIIPKRRSAMLTATVHKTSAGAASWVPVARVPNIPAAIDTLKKAGVWVFGTDMSGQAYTEVQYDGPCALVIGSEGSGMSRLVRERCDVLVRLPMKGRITSLNASVAAGIFMYEVVRQRG